MKTHLIYKRDYQRIYKTIYSILKNENAHIVKSCLYFSILGAAILQKHYKLNAKPIAGVAGYRTGNGDKNVLMFGELKNEKVTCSKNGFHCWVEVDGWLIDFMAPVFPQAWIESGQQETCESKMMQKKLNQNVEAPANLNQLGDFYLEAYPEFMEDLFKDFLSKPMNVDLVNIATNWYKRPPKRMIKKLPISDNQGNITNISLIANPLVGSW